MPSQFCRASAWRSLNVDRQVHVLRVKAPLPPQPGLPGYEFGLADEEGRSGWLANAIECL
jgi:hypothetical protein